MSVKQQGKERRLDLCSPGSFTLDAKDSRTKAELLQALKIVDSNMLFASANGDAQRFKEMFRDSEIACKYGQEEMTAKYTIQFGIAPCFKSVILKDIEGAPYCFKFDETTSQVKKQCDGNVTYFSGVLQKVISEYVGSLCGPLQRCTYLITSSLLLRTIARHEFADEHWDGWSEC